MKHIGCHEKRLKEAFDFQVLDYKKNLNNLY